MYLTPQRGPTVFLAGGVQVVDHPDGCEGSWSVDDPGITRTYTNKLRAFASSKQAGPLAIVAAVPAHIGDSYRYPLIGGSTETDTGSFLQSIEPRIEAQAATSTQWEVTLTYGPLDVAHQLGTAHVADGTVDPTNRAPEIYLDYAKFERNKPHDEGKPRKYWLNTAGDPLIETPKTEETRAVLTIVRNEAEYNESYAATFRDKINSDVFLDFYPPKTAKCRDIRPERIYSTDWGYFYRIKYEFEFRYTEDGDGYKLLIPSMGYSSRDSLTGDKTVIKDSKGDPVTDAKFLDKDGILLPKGDDPYLIEFTEFPDVAFEGLGIPSDILYV